MANDRTDGYCTQLIAVAKGLGLSDADNKHAAVICWTAVGGETTWAMYANDGTSTMVCLTYDRQLNDAERAVAAESLNYPHDLVGRNLDSMGLLQQRPMMEWGSPDELMDPATSFDKFLHGAGSNKGLLDQPGWQSDEAWHAAWSVQKCAEADVYVYQNCAVQAEADVNRLWDSVAGPGGADWFASASDDDLRRVVGAEIDARLGAIAITIWTKGITDETDAGKANALLASAAANGTWAAQGVSDLPERVWCQPITDETADVLLARAAGC